MSKSKTQRLSPEIRREQILDAAVCVAIDKGYSNMSRIAIANKAGCANGQVSRVWGTMGQLRRSVMRAVVKLLKKSPKDLTLLGILLEGLARGESAAKAASPELKKAALELVK